MKILKFKDLKIRSKLFSSFYLMVLLSIFIGLSGYIGLKKTIKRETDLVNNQITGVACLQGIKGALSQVAIGERGLLIHEMKTGQIRLDQYEMINSGIKSSESFIADYDSIPKSAAVDSLWKEFLSIKDAWLANVQMVVQSAKERDMLLASGLKDKDEDVVFSDEMAYENSVTSRESGLENDAKLNNLILLENQAANDSFLNNIKQSRKSVMILVLLLAACILLAMSLGYVISSNIQKIIKNINKQINDVAVSVVRGKLSTRADTLQTDAEFRDITVSFNQTMDAIVEPLHMASGYIESIGNGIIPERITEEYFGDFNLLKNSINNCIDGLQGLVEANRVLQLMSVNDFTEKINGNFRGIYSDVCTAVDLVRDRIIFVIEICERISEGNMSDREELIRLGKRSENDTLIPAIIRMTDAINNLIVDTNMLASSAVEGKLSDRADDSRHQGDFRKVVKGINSTLDSVVGPLTVASDYVSRISAGEMPPEISEKFNGDFNLLKISLNRLISALNEIIAKARLIADGDLTIDLKKRSDNDDLMQSLTDMVKSTAEIISEFKAASDIISDSSQQMSITSREMSQGSAEQASSSDEASTSMEQMTENIRLNTENAQQTEKIAMNAAEGINKVASGALQTLNNIQEIADKISIIGEIARQTNILALNAAVEAARAGEHGKGFAVVAAEVRKLAERSQVSAVEIDALTKKCVRITEDSVKMMKAIAPEIGKTAKLVQEIAAASLEQNTGAEQVNSAIQQLNHVTRQNASASEEIAAKSEELATQAQQLMSMISYFKIQGS
jgi:methyl-accepting chemotaxis protein